MPLLQKLVVSTLLLAAPVLSSADEVLFQSATLGQTGITADQLLDQSVPGTNVNQFVFVGARFELTEPVITSRIGGHFASLGISGNFFGAIVSLDGPDDLPDSSDLSTPDVLGSTLLEFPDPSDDVFGMLELDLDPGWYGVVFDSGLFGATGAGGAIRNNIGQAIQILSGEARQGSGQTYRCWLRPVSVLS